MTHDDFMSCVVQYGFYPNGVAGRYLVHKRHPGKFFEYDPTDYQTSFKTVMKKLRNLDRDYYEYWGVRNTSC